LFGNLFKAESKSRRKTNLMIFLRPVVLRSATDVEKFSTNKYNVIRDQQLQQQPQPGSDDSRQDSAVIPELKLP